MVALLIPVLYDTTETLFTSNGIGRLSDAIECTVTEERNGVYELFLSYPIVGQHFHDLEHSRIILAVPADGKAPQPFRIYRVGKPINGICSIYAEHISYELNHIPVMPFEAIGIRGALEGLVENAAQACPFTVWTDRGTPGEYRLTKPQAFRALLGGTEGSLLDVFGTGEYEFDRWRVNLWQNRGRDTGATIRYGKNLTDLTQDENIESVITGVCPYWYNEESATLVTLPEKAVWASTAANFPYLRTQVMDFSAEWEEEPTVAQLRERAERYIEENQIGVPKVSLDVKFVPLWQVDGASMGTPYNTLVLPARVDGDTLEDVDGEVSDDTLILNDAHFEITYESYKVLERINLCDTVTVEYPALGVSVKAKVVKTEYNVLKDRYNSIEIGDVKTTLADTIVGIDDEIREKVDLNTSFIQKVINHQTELITGGLGGHVIFTLNEDGQPEEILIMDTDDKDTAVNVIRANRNGIGFSQNGYEGPFQSAWTIDGHFNADFITAGTMLADRIYGGLLTLGGNDNISGRIRVFDNVGAQMLEINSYGISSPDGKQRLYFQNDGIKFVGSTRPLLTLYNADSGGDSNISVRTGGDFHACDNYTGGKLTVGATSRGTNYYSEINNSSNRIIGNLNVGDDFTVGGRKSRKVPTDEYGERLLYCYETTSPLFGDVGEGVIDETGVCYVFLDPVFAETIATRNYQVLLQKYGDGDLWVQERRPGWFIVKGTPNLTFGWELKARQAGYEMTRIERNDPENREMIDYGELAARYYEELEEGRKSA